VRILILHSRYLSGPVSGENRVVDDELTLLREADHDVRLWAPSPEGISNLKAGLATIWSSSASTTMRRLTDSFEPDIVHVHNLFPMLSPAVLRADIPIVMTLHNYRYSCLPGTFYLDGRVCEDCLGRVPWRGVVRRCFRDSTRASLALAGSLTIHRAIGSFENVDLFLAVSAWIKRKHAEAGLASRKIVVRTNFAQPVELRDGPGEYFLYAGRLAPEKGLDLLVRDWSSDLAPLLVAGDGPELQRLRGVASSNVRFLGGLPGKEIARLLRNSRAVVVPSRWYEGAPRSIIEAYATGVPVMASAIGAIPEVVANGRSGFLLPPEDRDSWLSAARRLMDDDESERLGRGAFEVWKEAHTPQRALEQLESAYLRAIDSRRS
jgi:glycosyltransferase involved in cell wall biosynthesis